ncbi:hypothetical protein F1643_04240 [Azospirillum sp. INR13]|uniref:hypothetical protein n=1 Tax=Azospirillum sp. INR13 TaxID=2596919 RepID=UPI0018921DE4|nr:hypothetical protein [Azospirillum sp. INR13]MBF5093811.1 hypothetical protein [Azospirillum sp. INR13]
MDVLYDPSLFRVHKVEKVAGILSKLGLTGRMKLHDRKELERQQRSSNEQEERQQAVGFSTRRSLP